MAQLTPERVARHRAETFRLQAGRQLRSADEAVAYVAERGFVFFWPIRGMVFPNLWTAVAGNRPVADEHDDPGHVTWGWKDSLLDQRRWYYAKILRGKSTMIDLQTAPYFYALSENYGDPEHDYLQLYEDGLLLREARLVYEALLREGPLDTVRLRRVTQLTAKSANSVFGRALTQLQRDFKILPVGVAEAGAWRYSFVYDLTHRHYPALPEQARAISRGPARRQLVSVALSSLGAATMGELRKLFQWRPRDLQAALDALVASGELVAEPGPKAALTRYGLARLLIA